MTQRLNKASIGTKSHSIALPQDNDGICEILLGIDARKSERVDLTLTNSKDDKVIISYDPKAHTLSMDRTRSGLVDFSEGFPAVTVTPTHETDGKITLRILIDRSSIEIFGNDGHFVMTNLVFPDSPYRSLLMNSTGGNARINDLRIYSLNVNDN